MDIKEIKGLQQSLTSDIENLINAFQESTGVWVSDVSVETSRYATVGGDGFIQPAVVRIEVKI